MNIKRKFNSCHFVRCKADYRLTPKALPLNEELKTSDNLYPREGNSVLGPPNMKRDRREKTKV